jgi:hypothetical protein
VYRNIRIFPLLLSAVWNGSGAPSRCRSLCDGTRTQPRSGDTRTLTYSNDEFLWSSSETSWTVVSPNTHIRCISRSSVTNLVSVGKMFQSLLTVIRRQIFLFQWLFQPIQGSGLLFSSVINFFTDGRNPWTNNQAVARPLPKHRTTQTQNKRTHTSNIHALGGIRTHDPSVRVREDSSSLRQRGYCDRSSKDSQSYTGTTGERRLSDFPFNRITATKECVC